jgi:membrane fusion protein, protease secretion system
MAKIAFLNKSTALDAQPKDPGAANAPDEVAPRAADPGRSGRIGLWALAIGLGGFLLWASFAPLDEGVAAPAQVSIDTKRKTVQHLTGGIVKEVLVREGQTVADNQVLIKLDEGTAKANFEASRQRYLSLRAMEARLVAEQTGAKSVSWHPDLVANSGDPLIKAQMTNQEQLLTARRASLAADMQSFTEQIQGQEQTIRALQSMQESRKAQLALFNEELTNTRGLVAEGYAPRTKQFELERSVADINSSIADILGNTLRARASIADMRAKTIGRREEYRKDVETQLADVRREVLSEADKFRALQADLGRMEIRAPAAGQVVGLQVQTAGGVIGPGQKLMDIVPTDEPLLLEAKVAPNFIDRVHAGLPVDIRFNAFSHTPTLVVEGKVLSVSGDVVSDPSQPGGAPTASYYLARVAVTPEGFRKLGKRQMQPGMQTEVVIRTGERSMLTYLIAPLMKRMAAAMKEE